MSETTTTTNGQKLTKISGKKKDKAETSPAAEEKAPAKKAGK